MASVDAAINTLNQAAQGVGEYMIRLDNKEATLAVSITNIESTRSRIEDADFAEEQMNLIRAQIVQQTGFASFAQANAAPQLVLSLFR
jgi:flagellin